MATRANVVMMRKPALIEPRRLPATLDSPPRRRRRQEQGKIYVDSDTGVRFDDVAGVDEAKDELREIV